MIRSSVRRLGARLRPLLNQQLMPVLPLEFRDGCEWKQTRIEGVRRQMAAGRVERILEIDQRATHLVGNRREEIAFQYHLEPEVEKGPCEARAMKKSSRSIPWRLPAWLVLSWRDQTNVSIR
jgi:hypothetical protein